MERENERGRVRWRERENERGRVRWRERMKEGEKREDRQMSTVSLRSSGICLSGVLARPLL
jgi:hypothetical protein